MKGESFPNIADKKFFAKWCELNGIETPDIDNQSSEVEHLTSAFIEGRQNLLLHLNVADWRHHFHRALRCISPFERQTIFDKFGIPEIKSELQELGTFHEADELPQRELEIANLVTGEVGKFKYKKGKSFPVDALRFQRVNCVGSSILRHTYFNEIGIKHFYADMNGHCEIVIQTSDGRLYWRNKDVADQKVNVYKEVTDDMLENGEVCDLDHVDKSNAVNHILGEWNPEPRVVKSGMRVRYTDPEIGLLTGMLKHLNTHFLSTKRYEESLAACRALLDLDPDKGRSIMIYGGTLKKLGRQDEAIEAYQKAIAELKKTIEIDPGDYEALGNLSTAYEKTGRKTNAIDTLEKFIEVHNDDTRPIVKSAKKTIKKLKN